MFRPLGVCSSKNERLRRGEPGIAVRFPSIRNFLANTIPSFRVRIKESARFPQRIFYARALLS